ncbi:MAG: hemerythrin domain-containing protein [Verrucomicrobiia bacterium]|jgi:hypothetical protein
MKATDVLISQHMFLRATFDEIERAMPDAKTCAEISAFARIAQGLLLDHAEGEETLLFAALDKKEKDKGKLTHFHTNHWECISLLKQAREAWSVMEAKSLLSMSMRRLRDHFCDEERAVVALAEKQFQPESLEQLGKAWMDRHPASESPPSAK